MADNIDAKVKELEDRIAKLESKNGNLTMVFMSGDFDKAFAAFIIANGALAMGKEVTIFATFWGLDVLKKSSFDTSGRGFLEKMVLRTCDAVITVGVDLEEYVKSVDPRIRVTTIENIALHAYETLVTPTDIDRLSKALNLKGRLPIVYTGTYERYQGLDMALECVNTVAREHPNVIFIFVGAKAQQAQIWTDKARRLNIQDHVLFLNVVDPEESMVYLACAKVLISPRLNGTSTPLKIYSYLHAGKPIVATNITSHTQVLSPENAVLVEPNKDAFAEGIIRVLHDPEMAEQISRNAYQYAQEKFNYQSYMAKVGQIYNAFIPTLKLKKSILSQEP